jgi:hypothetical protein
MEIQTLDDRVITQCRSCHADIVWTITEKGKRMPIDAYPVDEGNIRFIPGRPAHSVVAPHSLLDELDPADNGDRFLSHFVTCPHADQWRGGQPAPNTPGPVTHRTMRR